MRIVIAVLAAALVPTAAAAQGQAQGRPLCKDAAMPFGIGAGNRLTGAQLQQAVSGKRLGYLRESLRTPGIWVNNVRELRPDGSMVYTCEFSRSSSGPWRPCSSFGAVERQTAGSRDVGIWSIKDNNLCSAKASFGEHNADCFAIHRQGPQFAAKRVSGPLAACMEGAITLR